MHVILGRISIEERTFNYVIVHKASYIRHIGFILINKVLLIVYLLSQIVGRYIRGQ